jgi:tricorn protease
MKQLLIALISLVTASSVAGQAPSDEAYFLSNPGLSPDGKTVVFSYEGDLWQVSEKGGSAVRLTDLPGYETGARYSPDGKWIAFTGRQSGNADIYIISTASKEIRQLTFHSSADEVSSWSWDSRFIYFSSERTGQISSYKVSATGGTPLRLFGHYYFQNDHNLFEHPLTGELFFNNTWESSIQVQRKRYKGPFNPDIQSYNIQTKQYKRYTDYNGKDFGATTDRNGNIYFISDEANGEFNLYTFRNNVKTALTRFESSIKNAIVNADGGKVIFEKDYQLYIYEVKTGKTKKLEISLPRKNTLLAEKPYNTKGNITGMDVSPDGKKLAFTSRGEVFVGNADGTSVQKINKGSAERALEIKWLSDNKTLLFNQTLGGYLNWYITAADGTGPAKALTTDQRNNRSLSFNQDKTMAVYLSGRDEVRLMDLKTWAVKTMVRDEIWAIFADKNDPVFSPDGRFICYTAHRNSEEDLFVCEIATGKITNLTNTGVTETGPIWSADGQQIYFTASRLNPAFPYGMQDARIYRLPLQNLSKPFRSDKTVAPTEKPDGPPAPVVIDSQDMMERIEQIGPSFGSNYLVDVIQKSGKTSAFFISNQEQGKWAIWKTTSENFLPNKTEKTTGGPEGRNINLRIVRSEKAFFALVNGTVHKFLTDENRLEPIDLNYQFTNTLMGEFTQVFFNAWGKVEENYYDETFHGVDWLAIRNRYARFLPFINNRSDFRTLVNDMLGELNSSHQRLNTYGEEENVPNPVRTMETGILFKDTEPYKIERIIHGSSADKSDISLLPGDELIRIDSTDVSPNTDRNFYFTRPAFAEELKLAFRRQGQTFTVKIHPQGSLSNNLHDDWINTNRSRVADKSKGRIVYACMKDMEKDEFDRFVVEMSREMDGKDGLILDLRYNDGGQMHDEMLKFLAQRSYAQWTYRGGKPAKQGHFTPSDKPIVLLINEQTLSDGEMTSAGFKGLKLGKIVGNETYHWEIFTRPFYMVDGSSIRLSSWGCYTLAGDDLELNGIKPDIKVLNTFEDHVNARDPQLDRAVEEVLK